MKNQIEMLWTIDDVADFLQVKTSVIKYWIHNSDIPFIKLGKRHRFDPEEIKGWIRNQKNNNKPADTTLRLLGRAANLKSSC